MKTKGLISFAITAKLICIFVFAYEKNRLSHDVHHMQACMFFWIFSPNVFSLPHRSPPSPVRRGRGGGPRGGQRVGRGRGGFVTLGGQAEGGFSPRGGRGRGGQTPRGGRKNLLKRVPINNNESDPMLAAQIRVGHSYMY